MKEIWKAFSAKCKEAWNKTKDALKALFNDFVDDIKALVIQGIDLIKDLFGNTIKAIETVVMGLCVAILTALFEAIYDSVMYFFDWIKSLFTKKEKKGK